LKELNPLAPIHQAIQSDMNLESLLSVERLVKSYTKDSDPEKVVPVQKTIGRLSSMDKLKQSLGLRTSKPSLYNSIDSFSYQFTGPVHAEKFEDFLYALPKSVYRAKGYVLFHGKQELISFQHTDNQVHLFPFENFGPKMVAVFIGEGMDQEKILNDLKDCYV